MTRQALQPDGLVTPKAPYSPVVVSRDLVLTAGQVAFGRDGELVAGGSPSRRGGRSRTCDDLFAAGCGFEDVLKVNVFLVDLGDFDAYNDVYREFFEPPYPARTTVGAALPGAIRVEIEAVARRPA